MQFYLYISNKGDVKIESDVKNFVLENSVALLRRIFSISEEWKAEGAKPLDFDEEEWWDFACWRQLVEDGWEELMARTIVIP